jgi:hypothetical protein
MPYHTDKWYGFHTFKNETIRETFENKIDEYIKEKIYPQVHRYIFEPDNRDLTSVMYYFVQANDWCLKSMHTRLWTLAVGYLICKLQGCLEFSDMNKKYFYLDKITSIAQEVEWAIRSHIAKDFLIRCAGYMTMTYCIYKCAESLAEIIFDRLA